MAVPSVWAVRHEKGARFLLAWILPSWLVLEIVVTKLPHYVLALYPAIAILIAGVIDQRTLSRRVWLARGTMKYEVIAFATADETVKAYESGRCDVFTSDVSQLYAERLKLANPADHVVLPEVISKEPLGPMVRHGDDQWFDIVKWTLFAMVGAEEIGVTQKNVDEMAKSDKPELKRAMGTDGNLGEQLGLTKDWIIRIVKATGNYGEAFERNVGSGSKLGIARGLNQLWNKGGIQYAPPIR